MSATPIPFTVLLYQFLAPDTALAAIRGPSVGYERIPLSAERPDDASHRQEGTARAPSGTRGSSAQLLMSDDQVFSISLTTESGIGM